MTNRFYFWKWVCGRKPRGLTTSQQAPSVRAQPTQWVGTNAPQSRFAGEGIPQHPPKIKPSIDGFFIRIFNGYNMKREFKEFFEQTILCAVVAGVVLHLNSKLSPKTEPAQPDVSRVERVDTLRPDTLRQIPTIMAISDTLKTR